MNLTLRKLRDTALAHLDDDTTRPPLGGIGIFHSRRPQRLRNVPIHQPTLVLVASGRKVIAQGERRVELQPGELLLLPGRCHVVVGNHPDESGQYLGLAMGFSPEGVISFRRDYGGRALSDMASLLSAPAPLAVVAAMGQWFDWCVSHPVDPDLARHRQVELLLLLASAGLAGNLLLDRESGWRERLAQLVALDPAREWSAAEACRRLGIGESTLRRRLREEGAGFREVLEESRLVAGLALLQETFWPVAQVAEAVGYRSHSRFSERFKRRFGLTPAALKRTRVSIRRETESA